MKQTELFYFAIGLVSLLIILTSLFVYLVVQKVIENEKRRKINEYKERYQQTIFRYLNEGIGEGELSCCSSLKQQALMELLEHFSSVLASKHIQERIRQFAETHFQKRIREQLMHRRWSVRMNALFFIEDFRMKAMINDIKRLYHSRKLTKSEEVQILKIYAIFDYRDLYERMVAPKYPLTEFAYRLLFRYMSDDMLSYAAERFSKWPPIMQYAFIDIIGIRNRSEYGPFLERLLTNESPEIRIRSLKAIAAMGYFLDVSKLKLHLASPHWQERLMAIKVCGNIRANELIPQLVRLLCDETFSVRSQAAQSLLRMEQGIEVLKEVAAASDDPYARDMAQEWLERGLETWR